MITTLALAVLGSSILLLFYTYFGYPAVLWLLGRVIQKPLLTGDETTDWPLVSISVPAYNEEAQIEELIKSLLALDYPRDRLQILIVSDGSEDGTDEIVSRYSDQGIELLRIEERGGKTKAETAAAARLEGGIIINTDASIRIAPDAIKPLVSVFEDPEVGCASGRDVSFGTDVAASNAAESGYVGYEMGIRDLETRVSGIVGASGCFYAIRSELHGVPLPGELSRDFAAALHTREHGYRPVSVTDAVCFVPRTTSLKKEYRRKVRTIARGMRTLWHKRALLNPFRFGVFSWMLFSHKVCRWMLPWGAMLAVVALVALTPVSLLARVLVGGVAVVLVLAFIGWTKSEESASRVFTVPAYIVLGNMAAAHAFMRVLAGGRDALWEPTRREVIKGG